MVSWFLNFVLNPTEKKTHKKLLLPKYVAQTKY